MDYYSFNCIICVGLGVNYSKGRLHSLTVLRYGKPEYDSALTRLVFCTRIQPEVPLYSDVPF